MRNWSDIDPETHLDLAGQIMRNVPSGANGLHQDVIEAQMHTQAALTLALLQHREGRREHMSGARDAEQGSETGGEERRVR